MHRIMKAISAGLAVALFTAGVSGCGIGSNAAKVRGISEVSDASEIVAAESVLDTEEENMFSCVGGWESDNHLVYIFDEEGNAEHIINKINGKGDKQKVTPSKKVSYIWEEDSEKIYLFADESEEEFVKKVENDLEVIMIGKNKLYRMSDKELSEYKKLELAESKKQEAADYPGKQEKETIDLKETVLIDDEYITVTALQFVWVNETEPCVALRMTNKCEREIAFSFIDVYLEDTQVVQTYYGGMMNLQPGKNGTYQCSFYINGPDGKEYASSLKDLYGLNGSFTVWIYEEDGNHVKGGGYRDYQIDLRPMRPS